MRKGAKPLRARFCPECGSKRVKRERVVVRTNYLLPSRRSWYFFRCEDCGLNFKYSRFYPERWKRRRIEEEE